jgi:hypothetical protein
MKIKETSSWRAAISAVLGARLRGFRVAYHESVVANTSGRPGVLRTSIPRIFVHFSEFGALHEVLLSATVQLLSIAVA